MEKKDTPQEQVWKFFLAHGMQTLVEIKIFFQTPKNPMAHGNPPL
jgi:hypothetical protein